MKLPLDRIYFFPEFEIKEGYGRQREDLEEILNKIFNLYEYDMNDIVNFLEKNYNKQVKNKTLEVLEKTEIKEEEKLAFKSEDEVGGYIAYYLEAHPSEELKLVTKNKFIPKELKEKFLLRFGEQGLQIKGEDIDKFLEENKII